MIVGWLPFFDFGQFRPHARGEVERRLTQLVDEQQGLIQAQQEQIALLRRALLEETRMVHATAELGVALIDYPMSKGREQLAGIAQRFAYKVARQEEHLV